MNLTLTNGYPRLYPTGTSGAEADRIAIEAQGNILHIEAIIGFEWKYTLTVEFAGTDAGRASRNRMLALGWHAWGEPAGLVLEATTSKADGYEHPAIIAGAIAYCGLLITA